MKRIILLLVVGLVGVGIAASYFDDTYVQYTESTFNNTVASADSVRYTTNALPMADLSQGRSKYTAIEYGIYIPNADTCCGDTNGVAAGTLTQKDTGKIILQGERNGTWYRIRCDSGTLPYSAHVYLSGDSLCVGYDNIRFQLYAADTAANGDSVGYGGVALDVRLVK